MNDLILLCIDQGEYGNEELERWEDEGGALIARILRALHESKSPECVNV